MDEGKENTVAEFEQKKGVKVKYIEDVNDNAEFFGKLQPQLEKGDSGGRSMFVVTDWMAKQMYDLGYLQEIDHAALPNVFKNLLPSLESPAFDPERKFSVPWQTGMTGLMVNTEKAPDIKAINDLFDPKYKGKITVLTELRDTIPLLLKGDGIDPTKATTEEWLAAIEKLQDAVDSGQLRRFTGNDYTQDLTNENVVASIGWSGDTSLDRQRRRRMADAHGRLHPVVGQHGDPQGRPELGSRSGLRGLRLPAGGPGRHRRVRAVRDARHRGQADPGQARPGARQEPADLPERCVHQELHDPARPPRIR